jgi:hypothetical protein
VKPGKITWDLAVMLEKNPGFTGNKPKILLKGEKYVFDRIKKY